MKLKKSNLIWGIFFILAGVLYMLSEIFTLPFSIWEFWPLIIIIPSLMNLSKLSNVICLIFGVTLLALSLGIVSGSVVERFFIPICLIFIGLIILFKNNIFHTKRSKKDFINNDNFSKESDFTKKSNYTNYSAMFNGYREKLPHDVFNGADVNAIFGSVDLDMREAVITEDAVINCNAVFGGIDIIIPSGVNVRVSGFPIFGGISNKCTDSQNENTPTLYFYVTFMFGGVTIK